VVNRAARRKSTPRLVFCSKVNSLSQEQPGAIRKEVEEIGNMLNGLI